MASAIRFSQSRSQSQSSPAVSSGNSLRSSTARVVAIDAAADRVPHASQHRRENAADGAEISEVLQELPSNIPSAPSHSASQRSKTATATSTTTTGRSKSSHSLSRSRTSASEVASEAAAGTTGYPWGYYHAPPYPPPPDLASPASEDMAESASRKHTSKSRTQRSVKVNAPPSSSELPRQPHGGSFPFAVPNIPWIPPPPLSANDGDTYEPPNVHAYAAQYYGALAAATAAHNAPPSSRQRPRTHLQAPLTAQPMNGVYPFPPSGAEVRNPKYAQPCVYASFNEECARSCGSWPTPDQLPLPSTFPMPPRAMLSGNAHGDQQRSGVDCYPPPPLPPWWFLQALGLPPTALAAFPPRPPPHVTQRGTGHTDSSGIGSSSNSSSSGGSSSGSSDALSARSGSTSSSSTSTASSRTTSPSPHRVEENAREEDENEKHLLYKSPYRAPRTQAPPPPQQQQHRRGLQKKFVAPVGSVETPTPITRKNVSTTGSTNTTTTRDASSASITRRSVDLTTAPVAGARDAVRGGGGGGGGDLNVSRGTAPPVRPVNRRTLPSTDSSDVVSAAAAHDQRRAHAVEQVGGIHGASHPSQTAVHNDVTTAIRNGYDAAEAVAAREEGDQRMQHVLSTAESYLARMEDLYQRLRHRYEEVLLSPVRTMDQVTDRTPRYSGAETPAYRAEHNEGEQERLDAYRVRGGQPEQPTQRPLQPVAPKDDPTALTRAPPQAAAASAAAGSSGSTSLQQELAMLESQWQRLEELKQHGAGVGSSAGVSAVFPRATTSESFSASGGGERRTSVGEERGVPKSTDVFTNQSVMELINDRKHLLASTA